MPDRFGSSRLLLLAGAGVALLAASGPAAPAGRHPVSHRKKAARPAAVKVVKVYGKPRVVYERVVVRRPAATPPAVVVPPAVASGIPAKVVQSRPDHAPATWQSQEDRVFNDLNQERRQAGLAELKRDARLDQVARDHSRRMAVEQFFAHTSPSGEDTGVRADRAGVDWSGIAENLAQSVGTANPWNRVVSNWMTSRVHRDNLLGPSYREVGVGIWGIGDRFYFTAVFIEP